MMQTKQHSLIESITNVTVGYLIAVASQIIIFPYFDMDISIQNNFVIGLWFTGISIIRSYLIRRWFTKRTTRKLRENEEADIIVDAVKEKYDRDRTPGKHNSVWRDPDETEKG